VAFFFSCALNAFSIRDMILGQGTGVNLMFNYGLCCFWFCLAFPSGPLIHVPSILYLLQVQILKRLQRQAFYDIMQLRERQEKVERVISLFKATKVGPFAEESTRVKGVVNVAGSLPRDISEAESCISSRFVFEAPVRKKDSLFAELSTEHSYVSQENDHIETPFALSKLMYLSNISDSFSVAVVPKGARCKDFSTDQNIREVISSDEQRCLQYYHFAC
jgi:hypothetical protein